VKAETWFPFTVAVKVAKFVSEPKVDVGLLDRVRPGARCVGTPASGADAATVVARRLVVQHADRRCRIAPLVLQAVRIRDDFTNVLVV